MILVDAAAAAKSLQSCPTLCDSIDGSPPGSAVPGILQARTLEWVAISFSNAWKWKVKVKSFIRILHLSTPWTAAYQASPSMGFSRQEHWSGVQFPSPSGIWCCSNSGCDFCLDWAFTEGGIYGRRCVLMEWVWCMRLKGKPEIHNDDWKTWVELWAEWWCHFLIHKRLSGD